MLKRILIATAAAAALLPAAAHAKPHVLHYKGKTKEGTKIAFTFDGKWIDGFGTTLPTTCVSAQGGTPRVAMTGWYAPYKYRLGRVRFDYGDPTQHYHMETHRRRSGRIVGKLSINYSQLMSSYDRGYYIDTCLATASFSLRPRR